MTEPRDVRLKRLKMRSMRRGIKEMDLMLSAYAQSRLAELSADDLDLYERLLGENDQDLYAWITGQTQAETIYAAMLEEIRINYQK